MKHFRSLEIHKRSVLNRKQIWELVKTFPTTEKYGLTDQIIRSTRKCPANIAEGHDRFHWRENIQLSRIARDPKPRIIWIEHLSARIWKRKPGSNWTSISNRPSK